MIPSRRLSVKPSGSESLPNTTDITVIMYVSFEYAVFFLCVFAAQEKEGVEAISVGAILSDYQRVRVENV